MSKYFKHYAAYWGVFFLLFNVCAFVSRSEWGTVEGSESAFWIGYVFIILAFAGHLVIGYHALKSENATKMFYNMSLIRISTTGLIATFILGVLTMLRPYLDVWVDYANVAITILCTILVRAKFSTIIITAAIDLAVVLLSPEMRVWSGVVSCCIVLAITAMQCIGAMAAVEAVSDLDDRIKSETFLIKSLTVDAQFIVDKAADEEMKREANRVFEALRYSDQRSVPALASLETSISIKLEEFDTAVSNKSNNIKELADELVALIKNRNNKAKLFK